MTIVAFVEKGNKAMDLKAQKEIIAKELAEVNRKINEELKQQSEQKIGKAYQINDDTFFYVERVSSSNLPYGLFLDTYCPILFRRNMDETEYTEITVAKFLEKMAISMNKIITDIAKQHLISHPGIWGFQDD